GMCKYCYCEVEKKTFKDACFLEECLKEGIQCFIHQSWFMNTYHKGLTGATAAWA
ncbi:hypothetical protein L208DRAFT_1193461, partial [Tricholoma matsutake]